MAQYIVEHSFLFTQEERTTIYESVSEVKTKPVSLVTRLFYPLWSLMSIYLLNEHIAPNAITLCGVLCSLQSYQLISTYYGSRWSTSIPAILRLESVAAAVMSEGKLASVGEATTISAKADFFHVDRRVQSATVLATVLLLIAVMCGSLDGVHARRCRSYSVLGDIFSRVCTSISRVFMALTMLEVMHIEDISTRWYVVLALQLVEFNTMLGRINAANIKKDKVKNWAYVITYCFRDAELTFAILMILVARWSFPSVVYDVGVWLNPSTARIGYWALVMISFLNIALLKMRKRRKGSIAISLAARVVPFFAVLPLGEYNMLSVVGDAMVVGLLTAEVYISFLAHRRIHAAVVILCVSSLLNDVLAVVATCLYITGVLVDLSYSLNLPLFVPVRNVFIDGVFDLCHAGHKILMKNALSFGNRLVVGVCGDEECADYKRRPIMTLEERVNEVRLCKYVSEVIPNSPVTGITLNMINKHNIHLVVCGEEYNTEKDTYYAVPRKLGILRTAPRTEGISTSVLIARIRRASDDDVVARDKASGNSNVKDGS